MCRSLPLTPAFWVSALWKFLDYGVKKSKTSNIIATTNSKFVKADAQNLLISGSNLPFAAARH